MNRLKTGQLVNHMIPRQNNSNNNNNDNNNHNNGNNLKLETKLQHTLVTIMELQEKLKVQQRINSTLTKERDDFESMAELLTVQLQSAQTKMDILTQESSLDKEKLNEMERTIDLQKQEIKLAALKIQTQQPHHKHNNTNDQHKKNDIDHNKKPNDNDNDNNNNKTKNKSNFDVSGIKKYEKEIELLQKQLIEKDEKIEKLCNSLDNMSLIKSENKNLQNEIIKLQDLAQQDITNQVHAIETFEKENVELLNVNKELEQERDQLLNQINSIHSDSNYNPHSMTTRQQTIDTQTIEPSLNNNLNNYNNKNRKTTTYDDDDIFHAKYMDNMPSKYKLFGKHQRRGSNVSITSNMSSTLFLTNVNNNNYDFDIFNENDNNDNDNNNDNDDDDTPYSFGHSLSRPDSIDIDSQYENDDINTLQSKSRQELKSIINEYKLELQILQNEKENLSKQVKRLKENNLRKSQIMRKSMIKSRQSDSEDDNGYYNDNEEEETKEGDGYDTGNEFNNNNNNNNNKYHNRNLIYRYHKNESDIDNSDVEEALSVYDYTTNTKRKRKERRARRGTLNATNDSSTTSESELDEEEKIIQQEKTECGVRMNTLLVLKKLFFK